MLAGQTRVLHQVTHKHAEVAGAHQPDGAVLFWATDHQDGRLLLPQRAERVGLVERRAGGGGQTVRKEDKTGRLTWVFLPTDPLRTRAVS